VGAGAGLDLGDGTLDLGCSDLVVAGTLDAASGLIDRALRVSIEPGGSLEGSLGTLQLAGDWSNAGSFDAGSGTLAFVDGCGQASATLSGQSQFATLRANTTSGKLLIFEAGSTQTVLDLLQLAGEAGNLLEIRSSVDGEEAFLDLQGDQSTAFLDGKDNHAVGSRIAFGLGSTDSGNTDGWAFGSVPALPLAGLLGLALALLGLGARRAGQSRPLRRSCSSIQR